LIAHGEAVLAIAQPIFKNYNGVVIAAKVCIVFQCKRAFLRETAILTAHLCRWLGWNLLSIQISGVHWLYKTPAHAAEQTAGYKNDQGKAYIPIAQMFKKYGVTFDFTCLEMRDSEQPPSCYCGPEELVGLTETAAVNSNIHYSGENALERYDTAAYQQIEYESDRIVHPINGFTYLRLSNTLLSGNNWNTFKTFVYNMHNLL
jgi:hypothetical protein